MIQPTMRMTAKPMTLGIAPKNIASAAAIEVMIAWPQSVTGATGITPSLSLSDGHGHEPSLVQPDAGPITLAGASVRCRARVSSIDLVMTVRSTHRPYVPARL